MIEKLVAIDGSLSGGFVPALPGVLGVEAAPVEVVRLGRLLWLYATVPIALAVALFDQFVWNRAVAVWLPFKPESWVIWVYLFGMPHVVAGIQIFADKEYFEAYKWRLGRIAVVCLVVPVLLDYFIGVQGVFVLFMGMITYHTVSQQFGLTLVVLRRSPDLLFHVWKWSSMGVAGVVYTMIYWVPFPLVFSEGGFGDVLRFSAIVLLCLAFVSSSMLIVKHWENRLGVGYIFANMALVASEFYLFSAEYYFLVVVVGRVVHEFTAWPVYLVHDANRNSVVAKNWLFGVFEGWLPSKVLTLFLAFALGFALLFFLTLTPVLSTMIVSISVYHYYTEHFLWRRDSLLRGNVGFSS